MTTDPKIYIITFYAPNVNLPALNVYLNDSVEILGYWNHIPLIYCVKSRLSASALKERLRPFMPDPVLVAEINPSNMDGYMYTNDQWTWFYEPASEKRATSPGLAGLAAALGLPSPLSKK